MMNDDNDKKVAYVTKKNYNKNFPKKFQVIQKSRKTNSQSIFILPSHLFETEQKPIFSRQN